MPAIGFASQARERMSAITSCSIIITKRLLASVLVMLRLRKYHCNGHKCDIKQLFTIPVDFVRVCHQSRLLVLINQLPRRPHFFLQLTVLIAHTLLTLRLYESANQFSLYYHHIWLLMVWMHCQVCIWTQDLLNLESHKEIYTKVRYPGITLTWILTPPTPQVNSGRGSASIPRVVTSQSDFNGW